MSGHANASAGNDTRGARSIRQFYIPRPHRDEQSEIVALVDAAEDAVEAAQAELAQLELLKRALLQNMLSGRYRVRS